MKLEKNIFLCIKVELIFIFNLINLDPKEKGLKYQISAFFEKWVKIEVAESDGGKSRRFYQCV